MLCLPWKNSICTRSTIPNQTVIITSYKQLISAGGSIGPRAFSTGVNDTKMEQGLGQRSYSESRTQYERCLGRILRPRRSLQQVDNAISKSLLAEHDVELTRRGYILENLQFTQTH